MSAWLIYGKVIKEMPLPDGNGGKKIVEPQATFRALNYQGQRVSRLVDAGEYYEKEMAQKIVDKAQAYWDKKGYGDCVAYEIRKSK
jgi:hypothetical protein